MAAGQKQFYNLEIRVPCLLYVRLEYIFLNYDMKMEKNLRFVYGRWKA